MLSAAIFVQIFFSAHTNILAYLHEKSNFPHKKTDGNKSVSVGSIYCKLT